VALSVCSVSIWRDPSKSESCSVLEHGERAIEVEQIATLVALKEASSKVRSLATSQWPTYGPWLPNV
jgi:hypothetical protein